MYYTQSPKSGPKKWMNPQSAAIAGWGNLLKSRFESEIRAKIFSKSVDPFAYSPPPQFSSDDTYRDIEQCLSYSQTLRVTIKFTDAFILSCSFL